MAGLGTVFLKSDTKGTSFIFKAENAKATNNSCDSEVVVVKSSVPVLGIGRVVGALANLEDIS
jgi:UDP-glucose 6-dehydrogenase